MSRKNRQAWGRNCKGALTADKPQPKALGLLGLMGWLGFLVILVLGIVAAASWARQSGRQMLTRQCLRTLAEALVAYRQAEGEFPPTVSSSAELLKYLKSLPAAQQRLQDMGEHVFDTTTTGRQILDGWGRPLRYVFDGAPGQRPELKSQGPDPDDPADDIYAEGLQEVFIGDSAKGAVP